MAAFDSQTSENSAVPPDIFGPSPCTLLEFTRRFKLALLDFGYAPPAPAPDFAPNIPPDVLNELGAFGYAPPPPPPDFSVDTHLFNRLKAFGYAPPAPAPDFLVSTHLDVFNRLKAFGYAPPASPPDFAVNTHLDVLNRLKAFGYAPPASPPGFALSIPPDVLNELGAFGYAPPAPPPDFALNSLHDVFNPLKASGYAPPAPDFALNIPPDVLNGLGAFGYAPPAPSPPDVFNLNAFGYAPPARRPHLALNIPPDVGNYLNALGVGLAYSFANASNGYNPGPQRAPPTSSYTSNVQTPPPDSQLLDDYKAIWPVLLPVNVGSIFAIIQTWTQGSLSSYDRILICGIVCSAVAASVLCGVAHRRLHNPTTTLKWFAKAAITFTGLDIVGWMCILLPGVAKLVVMGVATLLCFLMMFAICE